MNFKDEDFLVFNRNPPLCPETGWKALVSLDCPATMKMDKSGLGTSKTNQRAFLYSKAVSHLAWTPVSHGRGGPIALVTVPPHANYNPYQNPSICQLDGVGPIDNRPSTD